VRPSHCVHVDPEWVQDVRATMAFVPRRLHGGTKGRLMWHRAARAYVLCNSRCKGEKMICQMSHEEGHDGDVDYIDGHVYGIESLNYLLDPWSMSSILLDPCQGPFATVFAFRHLPLCTLYFIGGAARPSLTGIFLSLVQSHRIPVRSNSASATVRCSL
jgi:hypothetical protein